MSQKSLGDNWNIQIILSMWLPSPLISSFLGYKFCNLMSYRKILLQWEYISKKYVFARSQNARLLETKAEQRGKSSKRDHAYRATIGKSARRVSERYRQNARSPISRLFLYHFLLCRYRPNEEEDRFFVLSWLEPASWIRPTNQDVVRCWVRFYNTVLFMVGALSCNYNSWKFFHNLSCPLSPSPAISAFQLLHIHIAGRRNIKFAWIEISQ